MMHPDHIFKKALYDHETPLEGKASFHGVMQKRKNKRRGFFWISLSSILLLLVSLTAASLLRTPNTDQTAISVQKKSLENAVVSDDRNFQNLSANQEIQALSSTDNKSTTETNGTVAETSVIAKFQKQSNYRQTKIIHQKAEATAVTFASAELANTKAKVTGTSTLGAAEEKRASLDNEDNQAANRLNDWIKNLTGRGIADEYASQILPTEGIEIPEFVPFYLPRKPSFNPIFELNITTAGNGYKNFRESLPITVAGNHRFSQYMGTMLFDMGRGMLVGAGLAYMENVGIGKALISDWKTDTNMTLVRITRAESVSYRLNKISVPLAVRYQLGYGRSLFRVSATLMPGIVTLNSGMLFSRDAIQSMDVMNKNTFTMDARLGAGMYYQVSPKTAVSAEPMLQYQTIPGAQWNSFNRFGFGFGLGVVFKP